MTTQKIAREDLQHLYKIACNDWKKKIAELAIFSSEKEIEVENPMILEAYTIADNKQKKEIEKYFKITSNKIQDRIKTLDDVYSYHGIKREDVIPYKAKSLTKREESINATADIQYISSALNERWEPDFTNSNQYKYYPYFERKSLVWVFGSYGCFGGSSFVGFGSLYKSSELATYAGTQFIEIYRKYLPN